MDVFPNNYEKASFAFLCCEIMVDWPQPHTASKRIALKVLHTERTGGTGTGNQEPGTERQTGLTGPEPGRM